jgi:hypothetical protein
VSQVIAIERVAVGDFAVEQHGVAFVLGAVRALACAGRLTFRPLQRRNFHVATGPELTCQSNVGVGRDAGKRAPFVVLRRWAMLAAGKNAHPASRASAASTAGRGVGDMVRAARLEQRPSLRHADPLARIGDRNLPSSPALPKAPTRAVASP